MRRITFFLILAACCVLSSGAMLRAQQVDAGIFNPSDSTLEIRLRPAAVVAGLPFSNVVFTVRWMDAYGVDLGAPSSAVYSVGKQGVSQQAGPYRYQKFAAATAQTVNWAANAELTVMTIPVRQTGGGTGMFELVNDSWTAAHNSSYYVELAGDDRTGTIWQGSADNTPLPLAVTALHASLQDGRVLLRWQAEGANDGIGFVVERCLPDAPWQTTGMVRADENDKEGWYFYIDPLLPELALAATLRYRLELLNADGSSAHSPEVVVQTERASVADMHVEIYPNPSAGSLGLSFRLPGDENVSMRVVDLLGRRVRTLVDREPMPAGSHARTFSLAGLSAGRYFVVITGGTRLVTLPLILATGR